MQPPVRRSKARNAARRSESSRQAILAATEEVCGELELLDETATIATDPPGAGDLAADLRTLLTEVIGMLTPPHTSPATDLGKRFSERLRASCQSPRRCRPVRSA